MKHIALFEEYRQKIYESSHEDIFQNIHRDVLFRYLAEIEKGYINSFKTMSVDERDGIQNALQEIKRNIGNSRYLSNDIKDTNFKKMFMGILDDAGYTSEMFYNELLSQVEDDHKLLRQIQNQLERKGYDAEYDMEEGCVSIADRVSPSVTDGADYNQLVKKIRDVYGVLQNQYGGKVQITMSSFDEWVGIDITRLT